ncbi:MAG: mannose-1-phosphate guanylyltransferase [Tepidisphaerales bacterium]
MHYGVILAGGAGTRLWPLSRIKRPKQLLEVIRGKSLLRLSYERLRGVLPPDRIYVCTNAMYIEQVAAALPELPRDNLLGEPAGRDTANAVGFAAAVIRQRDRDAVTAFVTADHVIEPVEKFQAALRAAFDVVAQQPESLVTFGIVPTFGHTGLGYVQRGEALPLATNPPSYRVQAFKEKPDKQTADRYVESGRYYWNSGMFVWRADTVLAELKRFLPECYAGYDRIAAAWNTPQRSAVLEEVYPMLQKISIDYAVMEPAGQGRGSARVVVVEMPVMWLDVGSFPSLAETLEVDDHNNAFSAARLELLDSDDNIVISDDPEHLIATIGLSDIVVVHTRDATLVCPKSETQKIKDLVLRLKERFGDTYQ